MTQHFHPGPHPDADQLSAYREGVLPEHERLECLAHFAECAHCREILFLTEKVLSPPAPTAPARRRWFAPLPVFSAAALAAGVLLIVMTLRLHHTSDRPLRNDVAATNQAQSQPPAQQESAKLESPSVVPASPQTNSQSAKAPKPFHTPSPSASTLPLGQGTGAGRGSGVGLASSALEPQKAEGNGSVIGSLTVNGTLEQHKTALQPPPPLPPSVDSSQAQQPVSAGSVADQTLKRDPQSKPKRAELTAELKGEYKSFIQPSNGDALTLKIEHNQGPANGLSNITGTVTDPSGAVIPGASVTLRQADRTINSTRSDATGQFTLAELPAGRYEVQISSTGFQTVSRQIELQPRDLALLSSMLPLGATTQTVMVESSAPLFETESATLQSSLPPLPNKSSVLQSVSFRDRTLAMDSNGSLFFKRNTGKHWKAIKPQWQGKVAKIELSPAASDSPSSFQLITDSGAVWFSPDGTHWHSRQP